MIRILLMLFLLPTLSFAAPVPPTGLSYGAPEWTLDSTLPNTIYDNHMEGWIVDMYVGNLAVNGWWYDAPQREIGMNRPEFCVTGADDKTYCAFNPTAQDTITVIEVDNTTGTARLFLGPTGTDEGPTEEARGGTPFYNSYDDSLYLMGYGYCLRKVVDDGDGTRSVEIVAGDCSTSGSTDDTGTDALFNYINGAAADGLGNIYVITGTTMRKIDVNGVVSTISPTRDDCTTNWTILNANHNMISAGDDETEFYISDQYNATCGWSILKFDTETSALTRVAGIDKRNDRYSRYNKEYDGPALTHSSMSNSTFGVYSPFYESYFINGNDNTRLHRLSSDGWIRTYGEYTRPGVSSETVTMEDIQGTGFPLEQRHMKRLFGISILSYAKSVCSRGGVFLTYGYGVDSIFRAYNPLLGGVQ